MLPQGFMSSVADQHGHARDYETLPTKTDAIIVTPQTPVETCDWPV